MTRMRDEKGRFVAEKTKDVEKTEEKEQTRGEIIQGHIDSLVEAFTEIKRWDTRENVFGVRWKYKNAISPNILKNEIKRVQGKIDALTGIKQAIDGLRGMFVRVEKDDDHYKPCLCVDEHSGKIRITIFAQNAEENIRNMRSAMYHAQDVKLYQEMDIIWQLNDMIGALRTYRHRLEERMAWLQTPP